MQDRVALLQCTMLQARLLKSSPVLPCWCCSYTSVCSSLKRVEVLGLQALRELRAETAVAYPEQRKLQIAPEQVRRSPFCLTRSR